MLDIATIRLVLIILVAIYLVFSLTMMGFLFKWRNVLNKEENAIRILLGQKQDVLFLFWQRCQHLGITLSDPNFKPEPPLEVMNIDVKTLAPNFLKLQTLDKNSRELALLSPLTDAYSHDEEIQVLLTSLDENDKNYRRKVASYNRNAAIYNYWAENITTILVARMFRHHAREKI